MNDFKIERISAAAVQAASPESLAHRPNDRTGFGRGGLSAQELKAAFAALAKLSIDKVNEIVGALGDDADESDLLKMLYTALPDDTDDEKKLSLSRWIERLEGKLADVPRAVAEMDAIVAGFERATATAQYVEADQPPAMRLYNSADENGGRTVRFELSFPRSELFLYKHYDTRQEMIEGTDGDGVPVGGLVLCKSMEPHAPSPAYDYAALCKKERIDHIDGLPEIYYVEELRLTGLSAFEIAFAQDPSLTEEKWLASLKGDKGDPFMISKTFSSVEEMNAGAATDGVLPGQYVAIDTNVEDPDSAKVFLKREDGTYGFVVDLSGREGIQGPPGPKGDAYTLTDLDKQEIANKVLAELPVAERRAF